MNSTEHAQLVDPGPAPLQQLALLEQLLAQLPLEQREILLLREVEGLAYTELATALTINLGTVKSRLTRAREAMLIGYHQAKAGIPMTEHLDMTVMSAYLDSELDGHERARATRHLHDCPACSATLAELRAISQGLQQLACAPPPVEPSAQLNPWFARQLARPRWLSHPLSAAAPIMLGLLIGNALPTAEHNLLAVLGSAPPGALCARPEFCYLKVNLK